ncbi:MULTISPECIES: carbamoyl-phosphate synthase [Neobacillus]|uniref:Carbamoyl-phosphate synthase n=1 Tax=Neobacillus citreus TaxID=2833578 RepID=A0A942STN8_9BACI|nr:carbamoyl-phosphate synthase [Neobacillus citreus]
MHHDIPAVVLDMSATGIGIVRSLAQKGIKVYAFDTLGKYKIGKTRHAICGACPNPVTEEEALLYFLCQVGLNFSQKAVMLAGSDDYVHFISKNRYVLSQYYRFLLPEHSLIEAVLDKRLTYELAVKSGVPCPKTFIVNDEQQLVQIIGQLIFPCILKPVHSSHFRSNIDHKLYKKAILIEDAAQLQEEYLFYRQYGELMIQEAIPGEENAIFSVKTFFDKKMDLKGLWMNQKLHQFPPHFGSSALVVSKREEEVIKLAVPFLKSIEMKGLAIAEFKKDPRDGKFKFIEINPRIGLTQGLSIACGVDLAYLYYLSLTNQDPEPVVVQKDGIKWVYFVRDFLSFRQKKRLGEMTFFEWLKGLSGKKVEALFRWDDPLPFIRSFVSHLRNLWSRR